MHFVDLVEASLYSLMNVPTEDVQTDRTRLAQMLRTLSDFAEATDKELANALNDLYNAQVSKPLAE